MLQNPCEYFNLKIINLIHNIKNVKYKAYKDTYILEYICFVVKLELQKKKCYVDNSGVFGRSKKDKNAQRPL